MNAEQEKNIKIEAVTKLDYTKFREFTLFNLFKGKVPTFKKWFSIAVLSLLSIAVYVFSFISDEAVFTFLTLFAVIADVYYIWLLFVSPKQNFKSNQRAIEKPGHMVFRDTQFSSYDPKTDKLLGSVKYENVREIFETKEFWYIYTSKRNAIIVEKAGVIDNMQEALTALLKEKKGKKYITSK
ncbi:MAG TPA: YcxB family protein [Bacillota bacterium]|nr:YcxB family protein [Bacillota bacterium]